MTLSSSLTLNEDFSNVKAHYSLDGSFSASVEFANVSRVYGATDRWAVLQIDVTATVESSAGMADAASFGGTTRWINGVVTSPVEIYELTKTAFPAALGSFFCTLARKSLNTHTYAGAYGTVIADILLNYCGIPGALYSVTGSNVFPFRGVVTGTNASAEIEKLAEAAYCEFFTQVGGILTVEPWKGSASSVDYVIPAQAVIKVTKKRSTERGPTRLTVKGRYTGDHGCGPKSTYADHLPTTTRKEKCYQNGAPEPSSRLVFKNLTADKQDLDNASFILTGDLTFDHMTSGEQKNSLAVVFASEESSPHYVEDTDLKRIAALIMARNTGSDTERHGTQSHRTKGLKRGITQADIALSRMAKLPPGGVLAPEQSQEAGGDGDDRNRVSCVVQDIGLMAEFGVVSEDVDNEYITDMFTAFIVGIRRLQRFRMQRNRYSVELVYIVGIEVNDVVTFTLPDGSYDTITGRVDSIDFSYTAEGAKAGITLEVDSFEELGYTYYQAPNLLVYAECCGINEIDWISSGVVFATSGYFVFEAGGSVYQPLVLVVGLTYVLSVELILLEGPGVFTISCGGATTTASGSTTLNLSFGPSVSSTSASLTATSGKWALTKPRLTTSVLG